MSTWDPASYGTFLDLRTRPSVDLVQRIEFTVPDRIVDLGCGPGNSTRLCRDRWPAAAIQGLDSSPEMIASARAGYPLGDWRGYDIGEWVWRTQDDAPDLILSCAALQWIGDHDTLFPRLLRRLASGGVLAAHMPDYEAVPNRLMRELAADSRWRRWFPEGAALGWRSHPLEFYYSVLAADANSLELWATDYLWIMPDVQGIIEWYLSTGLRPFLHRIEANVEREAFLSEYAQQLASFYPRSKAGGVPFTMRRIFLIART